MDRRTCAQPDRDNPKLVCGYPLPCPHHTFVVDVTDGSVKTPAHAPALGVPRVRAVARALRSDK